MGQLTAQVQMVIDTVNAFAVTVLNRVDHLAQVLNAMTAVAHIADTNGIQHRGNTAGDHQRIVATHC
jgi:hypothetical protein